MTKDQLNEVSDEEYHDEFFYNRVHMFALSALDVDCCRLVTRSHSINRRLAVEQLKGDLRVFRGTCRCARQPNILVPVNVILENVDYTVMHQCRISATCIIMFLSNHTKEYFTWDIFDNTFPAEAPSNF